MTAKKNPTAAAEAPAEEAKTGTALRNQLRNQAERHILETHRDEFDAYAEKLYTDNGLTFRRRVSAEEREAKAQQDKEAKAKAKLEKLYAEFPNLRPVEGQTEAVSVEDLQNTGGVGE
jgi:hypothetical protein